MEDDCTFNITSPQGTIACILCRRILSHEKNDKYFKHLEEEHDVQVNARLILAINCLEHFILSTIVRKFEGSSYVDDKIKQSTHANRRVKNRSDQDANFIIPQDKLKEEHDCDEDFHLPIKDKLKTRKIEEPIKVEEFSEEQMKNLTLPEYKKNLNIPVDEMLEEKRDKSTPTINVDEFLETEIEDSTSPDSNENLSRSTFLNSKLPIKTKYQYKMEEVIDVDNLLEGKMKCTENLKGTKLLIKSNNHTFLKNGTVLTGKDKLQVIEESRLKITPLRNDELNNESILEYSKISVKQKLEDDKIKEPIDVDELIQVQIKSPALLNKRHEVSNSSDDIHSEYYTKPEEIKLNTLKRNCYVLLKKVDISYHKKISKVLNEDEIPKASNKALFSKESNRNEISVASNKITNSEESNKSNRWTILKEHNKNKISNKSYKNIASKEVTVSMISKEVNTNEVSAPNTCNKCDKHFKKKVGLRNHLRLIHTDSKKYLCKICSKRFYRRQHLKYHHAQVHSEVKPYKCSQCNKCFALPYFLKSHIKNSHMREKGLRPYPCDICSKSYSTKSILKTHIRIHTGEKPFSCENCSKSFNDKTNLIRHRIPGSCKTYRFDRHSQNIKEENLLK